MECLLMGVDNMTCRGNLMGKDSFSQEDWISLKARTGQVKIKVICENHLMNWCTLYSLHQTKCCDPFNTRHSRPVLGIRTIDVVMHLKSLNVPDLNPGLIPGQKLCKRCSSDVDLLLKNITIPSEFVISSPSSSVSSASTSQRASQDLFADEGCSQPSTAVCSDPAAAVSPEYSQSCPSSQPISSSSDSYHPSPRDAALEKVNTSLQAIKESPVQKRKLTQIASYGVEKLQKIEEKYHDLFRKGGATSSLKNVEGEFYEKTMAALKNKFQESSSISDKVLVLSVALTGLPKFKVYEEFLPLGACKHMIKKTSKLIEHQGIFPAMEPKKGKKISEEHIQLVTQFYENDETSSRVMPGKKDFKSVREGEKKVHKQKRLILCNLKELHALFKNENPSLNLSFSKFASLRPAHCVLAGASGTHCVCVCKYHQNFKLLIEGAGFKEFDVRLNTTTDYFNEVLCNPPSPRCYLNSCCTACPGLNNLGEKLLSYLQEELVEEISYKQWTSTDRCHLETITKLTEDFIDTFMDQFKDLLPHHFITKQQSRFLTDLKEGLQDGEVVTICDFSENYSFIVQDSIQSYYWNNQQVTIHPFATYYKDSDDIKMLCFVVISDCMKHEINAVYTFQTKLITFLKAKLTNLKKIFYYSDGAAQQYKNRKNVINISNHEADFGIKAEWHFFATSHGKGPCDGLGATIKRKAARASLQGVKITTPKELFNWAVEEIQGIKICFVTDEKVQEKTSDLEYRFQRALQVPGMRNCHAVIPIAPSKVLIKQYSSSEAGDILPVELLREHLLLQNMKPGDFVTVLAGKSWKLGQIILIDPESQDILVNKLATVRKSAGFKFPRRMNTEPFKIVDILAVVQPNMEDNTYKLSVND